MMKKKLLIFLVVLFLTQAMFAENFTIFTGTASTDTEFFGLSFGGEILGFLYINFDFFKYLKDDQSLYSDIPAENRGDFLAGSLNFELKLPIHLIPYLDKFDFIQPYILFGYGYGLENLSKEYFDLPDNNGKTGLSTKLRQFYSSGIGIVVMVSPSIGIKIDYRSLNISEHQGMGYSGRKISRISFGICLGKYKDSKEQAK